ncbi:MAG: hypothetical protein HKL92_08875 [Candidatus Eremiobacteraeota bacterium]|nr:hypothetical protein [Candidatus Eremiobacteraeota bacterium]
MKLLDVNLLLYAYDASSPMHDRARSWFESCMNEAEPVGFPLATLVAFVRLATDARIFEHPFDAAAAYAIENGATLYTHDRDFLRFQRLRVEFPLSPA